MSTYKFTFASTQQKLPIIKVIGVGGGGSNAVNHMFSCGIKDVEFIICNTDSQALNGSQVPIKLQIGANLTEGLGAGANPERGKQAALENKEDIRELLSVSTKMLFITAGMGGGTGTGAAPIIAQVARELGILTVGIVTAPFSFEGTKKIMQANIGIEEMRKYCDTVLVISNDKLREIHGNMTMARAYAEADNVLATAAKSIAEIITVEGHINVDFEDVRTVMSNSGTALMGSAKAEGENRALKAITEALASPLLNNRDISGANKILLSMMSGEQMPLLMDEMMLITEYVKEHAGEYSELIFGEGTDSTLGEALRVTVIATGFSIDTDVKTEKKNTTDNAIAKLDVEANIENDSTPIIEVVTQPIVAKHTITPELEAKIHNLQHEISPKKEVITEIIPQMVVKTVTESVVETVENVTKVGEFIIKDSFGENFKQEFNEILNETLSEKPRETLNDTLNNILEETELTMLNNIVSKKVVVEVENTPKVMLPSEKLEALRKDFKNNNKEENLTLDTGEMELDKKRQLLEQKRLERLKNFNYNSDNDKENDKVKDAKDKYETPAYKRQNVDLDKVAHSSDKKISNLNINDDNNILGTNKFLSDKPD